MNKISKNQKGFTVLEGLLIVLILVVIGAVGYMVYHNDHKTKAVSVSTTAAKTPTTKNTSSTKPTTTASANPYDGWKTYTLKNEKLSFEYPSSWTLSANDNNIDGAGYQQAVDGVFISAPGTSSGSSTLSIEDGANAVNGGGGVTNNPVPIKYVGSNNYLVFSTQDHPGQNHNNLGCALLLTDLNNPGSYPLDKYVTDSTGDNYMYIVACTSPNTTYTISTINQAINDPVFKSDELIIESMHY
jgi:uncharacterized protein (UPF0333 family)